MSQPQEKLSAIQKQLEYWRAYGMNIDPFENDVLDSQTFLGEDREQLLRKAQQLARDTSQALVFYGPRGVGKTIFLQALQTKLEAEEQLVVVAVPAGRLTTTQQLLNHLGQAFDLRSEQLEPAEIEVCIKECLQEKAQSKLVILVDDADQLPEFTLASLLVMANYPDNYISVLLSATSEHGLLRAELQNDEVQQLAIEPFDADTIESYLRYRLDMAGAGRNFPFTEADIDILLHQSRGIPQRVDELAQAKLQAALNPNLSEPGTAPVARLPLTMPKLSEIKVSRARISQLNLPPFKLLASKLPRFSALRDSSPRVKLPRQSLAAVAGVLVFFLGIWLFSGSSPDESTNSEVVATSKPKPQAESSLVQEESPLEQAESPAEQVESPAAQIESPIAEAAPDEDWVDKARSMSPAAGKSAAAQSAKVPSPSPGAEAADASPVEADAKPIAAAAEQAAELESAQVALAEIEVNQKYIDRARQALPADELSLLNAPKDSYTLQLLGRSSQSGIRDFVENYKGIDILVFEDELNGKPWYVAVTGSYNSVEQARGGLAGLPQTLRELKPWPRQFGSVQDDIRKFRNR